METIFNVALALLKVSIVVDTVQFACKVLLLALLTIFWFHNSPLLLTRDITEILPVKTCFRNG